MTERMSVAAYRLAIAHGDDRAGRRKHKYGAKPQKVDGKHFASKFEAERYGQLKLLLRAGSIRMLRLQPRFDLVVDGQLVGVYVGDFGYEEPFAATAWREVVEDTKGVLTALYKLKKRLFVQLYPHIDFREIKRAA